MGRVSRSSQNQYGVEAPLVSVPRVDPYAGMSRTEKRRAARRSTTAREAPPTSRAANLPASVNTNLAAYDESVTLPGMTRDYGDNYKEEEIKAGEVAEKFRKGAGFDEYQTRSGAPAPSDPYNTGATGTQMGISVGKPIPNMTYESFMSDIGTKMGVNVRPALDSANLPGTAGYGESFRVDPPGTEGVIQGGIQARVDIAGRDTKGIGPLADAKSYAAMVDGTVTPKITLNAQRQGEQERAAENARQLTPGQSAGMADKAYIGGEEGAVAAKIAKEKGARAKSIRGAVDSRFDEGAEYGESYASPVSEDRMRARAAFLDPNVDSMTALRRAEGEMGLIAQGGKKFARDDSAEGGLREISQGAYRTRMGGGDLSEAMKASPLESKVEPTKAMSNAKDKAKSRIDKVSGIGPVADGLEYATSLGRNVGPVADGLEYAQSLGQNVGPFADPKEYLKGLGRN